MKLCQAGLTKSAECDNDDHKIPPDDDNIRTGILEKETRLLQTYCSKMLGFIFVSFKRLLGGKTHFAFLADKNVIFFFSVVKWIFHDKLHCFTHIIKPH